MECEFQNPVNYLGKPPLEGEPFQFQNLTCDVATTTKLIENSETGASFFIGKTLSYGDLILITFLVIFLLFGIVKFIWNFIQQNWNFKI